jgi:hypothetical protein
MRYVGSTSNSTISISSSNINSFIESGSTAGVWTPAIVSNENYVSNKPLFNKQNITNTILGIESALSFPASFKNWDILDTNGNASSANMVTNWYITSIIPTAYAEYGLLFWYKPNDIPSSSTYLLTDIPNGTLIKSTSSLTYTDTIPSGESFPPTLIDTTPLISTTTELMKIDNNTLKILNKSSNNITGTGTTFWADYDKFYLNKCASFDIKTNTFSVINNNPFTSNGSECSLWISDGEVFSYFDSEVNKNKYRSQSLPSKTYLSPLLMPIYREIYDILTLRIVRSLSTGLTKAKSTLLQKLCYFLSTFPLIDRTTVNILSSKTIHDAVQTYINTAQTSASAEITALKAVLNTIATEYKSYNLLSSHSSKQTLKNNYINNNADLAKKLLTKYGAQLYIDNNLSLKYKSKLSNGPHALLGLSSVTVASKSISNSTILYNNFKADIGNISYSTDISTTGSIINISVTGFNQTGIVPLADIGITRYNPTPFALNNNLYKEFVAPEIYFRDINPNGDVDGTYYWEQISGPKCLRFTDYNRDRFRVLRYKTSTDYNPDIYVRQAGTYGLRCTRNVEGIVESDEVFVTTDENFSGPVSLPGTASTNNKIINSIPRKLGFNKHGLAWIVDTDHYIKDNYTMKSTSSFGLLDTFRLTDIKIDIPKPTNFAPIQTDADLKLTFSMSAGDTKLLLDGINIEHARYKGSKYSQCCSFYEEKIYRDPRSPFLPVLGSSNFSRDNGAQYNLTHFNNNGEIFSKTETLSQPSSVSTALAPRVLPYGGYNEAKIDTIGIKMPMHDKNKPLPLLQKRNDIVDPPNIYCFLKEVKPTNSDANIFYKGFFDPVNGFKITDDTNLKGKSLVTTSDLNKQKSFVFKGNGFFSLKPSSDNTLNFYTSNIKILENATDSSQQYLNNYGYKNYNDPKLDSNFVINNSEDSWTSMYDYSNSCGGLSQIEYAFPSTGIVNNLYIKNIDIKLNFLNYVNPKELIVWLDITSSTGSSPSIDLLQHKTISDFSGNSSLYSYHSALTTMNSSTAPNTDRVYLLNQEHISNYEPNFSLTFSDNADKAISTSSQNHNISTQYRGIIPISNGGSIQPTLYANGYDDLNSELYIANIKNNQINTSGCLLKFKDKPLKDMVFSLNVGFVNPMEYSNKIMDNLLINNLILTGKTTENFNQSNTTNNSLCSWELKIDTSDAPQFPNSDVLGKINYTSHIYDGLPSSAIGGYNFIGDFQPNSYLMPIVHSNAPYYHLANINQCSYDDVVAGKNWSYMRPTGDENLRTVSLGAMQYVLTSAMVMGGGSFGAVGALMGIYALQALYERGGRSDPIINFFIETKLLDQTDTQDSQFYKPVYSSKFFGLPDKAIVCISQDQNYWYTLEVPIFNMFNSFVVQKQEYDYIKLYNNIIPGISNFKYDLIRNYADLDLAPVIYTYNSNVSSLTGEQDGFVEGDMVLLNGQNTNADNGYYVITPNSWIKVPSITSSHFLRYNNISSGFNASSLSDQKHILIDGIRAYHFFDKNESITLNTKDGNSNATISQKSYIQTTTGVKTVLTLNISVAQDGTISKDMNNANVLWLYKKNFSYPNANENNKWMLAKTKNQKAEDLNPLNFVSAYGEGSMNSGSDILDPDILYKMSFKNSELLETNKLLNNESNDKYKFNRVFLKGDMPDTNGGSSIQTTTIAYSGGDVGVNLLKGYSYTLEQFLSKPISSNVINTVDNNERYRIQNSLLANDWSDKQFMEIKSDKLKGTGIPASGSLHIENDLNKIIPVYFSSGNLTNLSNRLSLLSTGIIPGSYAEYYSLDPDPLSCFTDYSEGTCPKTSTYQKIKVLEAERKNIEIALSLPSTADGFIPYVSGIVSSGTDGSTSINYAINPYRYWIHIDPEQQCRLNDELSVKVLKEIRMRAVPISEVFNEGITSDSASHIVPQTSFLGIPSGVHNMSGVYMDTQGLIYSYKMGDTTISESKKEWSTGIVWGSGIDETFKYGSLGDSGDSKKLMISRLDSSKDMLVITEETYIRPSGTSDLRTGKIKDRIDLDNQNTIYLKFRNIPRKLKSIDSDSFDKYIYNRNGSLVKSSRPPSSVGQIANNFTCWHCVDSSGIFTGLPPYYQVANEMRYRSFFGSSDGIENKNTLFLDTKEDWEWIPYEYYSEPGAGIEEQETINFLNSAQSLNQINTNLSRTNYFSTMSESNNDDDDMSYLLYGVNYEKYFAIKYRFKIEYYLYNEYYIGREWDWLTFNFKPKYKYEIGKNTSTIVVAYNEDQAFLKLQEAVNLKTNFINILDQENNTLVATWAVKKSVEQLPRLPTEVRYEYIHKAPVQYNPLDLERYDREFYSEDRIIDLFEHVYFTDRRTNHLNEEIIKYPFRITILSSGFYAIFRYYSGQWVPIGPELNSDDTTYYFDVAINFKGIYEAAKAPLIPIYKQISIIDTDETLNTETKNMLKTTLYIEIDTIVRNWKGGFGLYYKGIYEALGGQITPIIPPMPEDYNDLMDGFGFFRMDKPAWFEELPSLTYAYNDYYNPDPLLNYMVPQKGQIYNLSKFRSAGEILRNTTKDPKSINQRITRFTQGSKLPPKI